MNPLEFFIRAVAALGGVCHAGRYLGDCPLS